MASKVDSGEEWITAHVLRQALSHAFHTSALIDLRLEWLAGQGLIQIKVQSAKISTRNGTESKSDWMIPEGLIASTPSRRSRAKINIYNDTLETWRDGDTRYTPENIGCVGLTFAKTGIKAGFPEFAANGDGAKPNDGASSSPPHKGAMPPSAKPNDRTHEDAAHRAAEIVRNQGATVQKACAEAIGLAPRNNREDESIIRAIRSAYDLMYDRSGVPHQT